MANIVIIEDNPANLELMCYLLVAFGHSVVTAVNGEDGLALVHKAAPELIICDVHLPRVDGYQVARTLKADPGLSGIPLLAVTALAMVGDREKGLAAGFDGYLFKPIEPETFVSEVERYLNADLHGTLNVARSAQEMPITGDIRARHGKILVVDDSTVDLDLFRNMLEPLGYQVWLTGSVDEGYDHAVQHKPDLILSDLHMQDEDGAALFQRIRTNAELAETPIIFISSTMDDEKDRKAAQGLGSTRFLVRPIEPAILLDEISAVLAERRG